MARADEDMLASHRGRVIVVDDDHAQRRLMTRRLERNRFEVRAYATGDECLAHAVEADPDVILLDINMPGMGGIETCRRLKRMPELQLVPVVFVTGQHEDDPTTIEALAAGGNDVMSKDASQAVMIARLCCQVTINRTQRQLRKLAMTDELTGLFSRRFLFDSLRRTVKAASRVRPRDVACLLADLDHFKAINDVHGHMAGDAVLRATAEVIRASTRESDIVGRFGGEEFIILLPDTGLDGALVCAEKIRANVETRSSTTISIGVSVLEPIGGEAMRRDTVLEETLRTIIHRADAAMYAAKRGGRNRVCQWVEGM